MLSPRSERNLQGVHKDLVSVVRLAGKRADFIVTEGVRTMGRQKQLVAAGASQTMNSRHLTGHAVDVAALVDGKVRWDWTLYARIAEEMKAAAKELNVPIIWGGDFRSLKDGPHFELDRKKYP
jgi:peptidoglycan L-alanyl-D-glutamate endopeptidase CwlK